MVNLRLSPYLSSRVDCIHTSLPIGRLREASAAATSGPKPRAVMLKLLELLLDPEGESRSIMHSGGREKVVVIPDRLTDEVRPGRTGCDDGRWNGPKGVPQGMSAGPLSEWE